MSPIRAIPLVCFRSGGRILSPAPDNLLVLLLLPHLVMRALYMRNTAILIQWKHAPLSVTQHCDSVHIPAVVDCLCQCCLMRPGVN